MYLQYLANNLIMKIIFFFLLTLSALIAKAQDTTKATVPDTAKLPKFDERNIIFTKAEIPAAYPGGIPGWSKYLGKNLHYPDEAVNKGIQGTVVVQFIVDIEGNLSEIEVVSGPEKGGLKEEAIRVIAQSGKWIPAMQNGRKVKSYKKQPMNFRIGS
jgi:TonB family protein